jgi:hypothetical protein
LAEVECAGQINDSRRRCCYPVDVVGDIGESELWRPIKPQALLDERGDLGHVLAMRGRGG